MGLPPAKLMFFEPLIYFDVCQHFASETRKYAKLTGGEPAKHTKYAKHPLKHPSYGCRIRSKHPLFGCRMPDAKASIFFDASQYVF